MASTYTYTAHDDALYRALGLLARQLHIDGAIDITALLRDMDALSDELPQAEPGSEACAEGLRQIAASFRRELPTWDEARTVAALYRAGPVARCVR